MSFYPDKSKYTPAQRIEDKNLQICKVAQLRLRSLKKSLEKFLDAARKVNPNAFEAWQCFGALQLAYQYAMMKAAVSASGSYGTCTIYEAKFIDKALLDGDGVRSATTTLYGSTFKSGGWASMFDFHREEIPAYAQKCFAYVEKNVPPQVGQMGAFSTRVYGDYLSEIVANAQEVFKVFSMVCARYYYVNRVRNGKVVQELNYTPDKYEAAFGTEDKEIVELCNKAFRQIFVLPWQGKSGK